MESENADFLGKDTQSISNDCWGTRFPCKPLRESNYYRKYTEFAFDYIEVFFDCERYGSDFEQANRGGQQKLSFVRYKIDIFQQGSSKKYEQKKIFVRDA